MGIAAILFALAALGGLTMAGLRFSGTPRPPTWLALGHGAIAATGVGVLTYTAATEGIPKLGLVSLGAFVVAAIGGAAIFLAFHLRHKPLPHLLMLGHGAIAVTAFVLLLIAMNQ